MKKLISILLSVLMLSGVITAFPASAAEEGSNADFAYVISGDDLIITEYLGKQYNVTVPETIDGHTVTGIGTGAFAHKDASALRNVKLPASIKFLKDGAFTDLSSSFTLDYFGTKTDWDNKVSVGSGNDGFTLTRMSFLYKNTFWYRVNTWGNITVTSSRDSVEIVDIPDTIDGYTVKEIGAYCFDDDWTTEALSIPDTVTILGYCSIGECSIRTIQIGSGLKTISQGAFEYNTHLEKIYYNGTAADWAKIEIDESGNDRLKEVEMNYVQEINTFDVSGVVEPIVGEKPYFSAQDTNTYSVSAFTWYNVTDGFKLTDKDTFEEGKTYRAQLELYSRLGCRFIYDNASARINGKDASYSSVPGVGTYKAITIKKDYLCVPGGVLTNIAITGVTEPKAGDKPVFEADSTLAYTISAVKIRNKTDDKILEEDDVYEAGKEYGIQIYIDVNEGYSFAVNGNGYCAVSALINGKEAQALKIYDTDAAKRIVVNIACPALAISKVEITDVVEPEVGQSPSDAFKVLTKGVTVTDVKWSYDNEQSDLTTNMQSGEKFEAGKKYSVYFKLSAEDGYKFAVDSDGINTYTATVNGKETAVYTTNHSTSEKETAIKYFFPTLNDPEAPAVSKIDEISISNLLIPRIGNTLAQTADADGHYTVESISWYDVNAHKWLSESDVAESGKQYEANVHVRADEGYEFAEYTTIPASINGAPASEVTSVAEEDHFKVLNVRAIYQTLDNNLTEISKVEFTEVVEPKAGEEPVFIFSSSPEGFTVKNGVVDWYNLTDYKNLVQGDKFEAGKQYAAYFMIYASDGYKFAVDKTGTSAVVATVNGNVAETQTLIPETYDSEKTIRIRYDFSVPADSTLPTEVTEPTQATDSTQPTEATEPTQATDSTQPTEATQPTQPSTDKPTEPVVTQPVTDKPAAPAVTPTVKKKTNPIKVTVKKSVKAKAKKKTTIKKAIIVKKAQGKVTYKTNNKKVKIKKGKLIIAKGLKKGKTYKVKITITAKGNKKYKSKKIIKTIKIKVK